MSDRVVVTERWPSIPGQSGETRTYTARRRAISADGRWWEIRRNWLHRWRWCPVNGMFMTIQEMR